MSLATSTDDVWVAYEQPGSRNNRIQPTEAATSGQLPAVVNSIGDAGARMVGVLKQVLPLSEARLAALLYQAPAELIGGLTYTC